MRALRKIAMVLGLSIASAMAIPVSRAEWFDPLGELNTKVTELILAGDEATAFPLAERAFRIARERRGQVDKGISAAIHNWSILRYFRRGQYAQSAALEKESLAISEKLSDWMGVATSLGDLADTYRLLFRWSEAETFYKRAIALYESRRVVNDQSRGALFIPRAYPGRTGALEKNATASGEVRWIGSRHDF